MNQETLIPHLFRTEYRKIIAVLSRLFGIAYIEIAEDIASETFLLATELWVIKGVPENPAAWLYTVAKNKTRDYLRHDAIFAQKVAAAVKTAAGDATTIEIDLTTKNIEDSQLAMMFAICHPVVSPEAQVSLSLNLLCGFGAAEIADAFLTSKEVIYKRLARAKEKLRSEKIKIEQPGKAAIRHRLPAVLTTLYLLFNEGYYSSSQNTTLRKDLCLEAMRLNCLLVENKLTTSPAANALLSLMCFHASRFDARTDQNGEMILYEDQDVSLWNDELVAKGEYYLNLASRGKEITKYHLEAAIAYWHTCRQDTAEKWESILQLYNRLLQLQYSPVAALNRTFALAKANGKPAAIAEAEKLQLSGNYLYYTLLGHLYTGIDNNNAIAAFRQAFTLATTNPSRASITKNIQKVQALLQIPNGL